MTKPDIEPANQRTSRVVNLNRDGRIFRNLVGHPRLRVERIWEILLKLICIGNNRRFALAGWFAKYGWMVYGKLEELFVDFEDA